MNNKFIKCSNCVYNIGDYNKILCNIMTLERPVEIEYNENEGCTSGYDIDEIYPPIDYD